MRMLNYKKLLKGVIYTLIINLVFVSNSSFGKEICNTLPEAPLNFHEMELETYGAFDSVRLGIGATYFSENERLSIIKFDYDYEKIDDKIMSEFIISAIKGIEELAQRNGEKIFITRQLDPLQFSDITLHNIIMHLFKQGKPTFEFLGMGHNGKCIIKIRYTHVGEYDFEKSAQRYGKYLRSLERYLDNR
jgi:hypothetical protein